MYKAFNQAAIDHSGINLDDYLGLTARELYHGEYGERVNQTHVETYQTAKPTNYEFALPINGKLLHIRTTLTPTLDGSGKVVNLIGAPVDISSEIELKNIRTRTGEVERELREFIYLAAHDLRSPMKKIKMFADILREDFEDLGDGKVEVIDMLERVSVESIAMVQSVLKHAEISDCNESVEHINLSDVCLRVLETLDPEGVHKSRIDGCSILGDRVLIEILLRNLIDNAIKHNPTKAISFDITAEKSLPGYFTMKFTDNGQGMSNPHKLFEADSTGCTQSGFGLLAISKLIKTRGGEILAMNPAEGSGLCIKVTLPGTVSSN